MSDWYERLAAYWRRRSELESEIAGVNAEIATQRNYITCFTACQNAINDAKTDWEECYNKYCNIQLSPVSLKSYFEGDCANKATGEILPAIAGMNKAASVAGNVVAAIPAQISKIQDYINQLEEKRASLQADLNSLVI